MATKTRSPKQNCQFFRWRFKGWLMGSRSIIKGFMHHDWLNKSESARLRVILTDLEVMIHQVDERSKKIIKEIN